MQNKIQRGDVANVTAPADVSSGDPLLIGSLFGVCVLSALSGTTVPIVLEGVFSLPKATGTAWTQGDPLYWDATAKNLTKTAADNLNVGAAFADAASGDAVGNVKINESGAKLTGLTAPQAGVADLAGTLTGTIDGTMVDVAATAASTGGGATPAASDVDTGIATAVASIVTGVNTQNKEMLTKINAILAVLRAANLITD